MLKRACSLLDPAGFRRHAAAQLLEELDLPLEDPLVCAHHLFLVLLQRRRDEPLAARDRLLAVIVGRHRVEIRFRDLDVVPEHAVIADLQRADTGALALALFELGDHLLARSADTAQVVELGIKTIPDVATLPHHGPRLVDDAAFDVVADVLQIIERAQQRAGERRLAGLEQEADLRDGCDRLLQANKVARAGVAERCARNQALEILHALEDVAELAAVGAPEGELFDRVQPIANAIERDERAQQPRSEQPPGHRSHRAVDLVQ